MDRFILLAIFFTSAICCSCKDTTSVQEKRKSNLIFILTDEQRYDTSAPYGNDQIKTPNLNRLGEQSVVFQNAYVSMPVCSPARSTILTGLYPHTSGVTNNNIPLDEEIKTLPELIKDTTYQTAYIGKWHLGRENDNWHGFDLRISTEDGYTSKDTTNQTDYNQWLQRNGYEPNRPTKTFSRNFASELPYEFSKSKYIETKATEFLEKNQNKPFVMYLGFLEPHSPYNGPFNTLHDTTSIILDSTYYQTEPSKDAPLRHHLARGYGLQGYSVEELFARYWGLVHQVDLSVGVIMSKLEELGLDENTIVVFTSEHGTMNRKFGLTGKTVMYGESSRVPLMIKAPNIGANNVSQPVSQIDLIPTMLELLAQPIPTHLQGESLVPLMKGDITDTKPVFMEWNPFVNWESDMEDCPEWASKEACEQALKAHIRTVVTPDGWKLNWNTADKSQLFNLNNDPNELHNLFEAKEYRGKVEQLKNLIREWQQSTNDPIIFKEI